MGLTDALGGRRGAILAVLASLGAFTLALVLWIGDLSGPQPLPGARGAAPAPGGSGPASGVSPDGTTSAKSGGAGTSPATGGLPALPLPPFSTDIGGAPHGTHIVTMRATSDATILQLAYAIRGGQPPSSYRAFVRSPADVTTVAHGDGVVAELAVQASPRAKTVTCAVTVDGVTTTHTATGGYAVVVCVG